MQDELVSPIAAGLSPLCLETEMFWLHGIKATKLRVQGKVSGTHKTQGPYGHMALCNPEAAAGKCFLDAE